MWRERLRRWWLVMEANKKLPEKEQKRLKGQIRHRLATHNYEPVLRKPRVRIRLPKWNNPRTGF